MQNTRVSQLGDPLQVGVQAGAWCRTVASLQVCICREELLALDPDNLDLFYNLGLCYVDLGQLDRGIELLLRCLKLAPGHSHACVAQALTYQRAGDLPRARECAIAWPWPPIPGVPAIQEPGRHLRPGGR